MNKVDFGSKYKFVADSNPPPGYYNADAAAMSLKTKSRKAVIKEPTSNYHKPEDITPDHYRVHVPWTEGPYKGINKQLTRVSDVVDYGTPARSSFRKTLTT